MIALQSKAWLISRNQPERDIGGYQHLSIPSDLCLHFTKRANGTEQPEYIFFDTPTLESIINDSSFGFQLLFTYVGPPVDMNPEFTGTWYQAVIISPFRDKEFAPNKTRVFIDFFVHTAISTNDLLSSPFVADNMRLAYDRNGATYGPFLFNGLQRKPRVKSRLLFSIRYGYAEMPIEQDSYVFVPYEIRERRRIS